MKKQKPHEVMLNSICAQLYSRLILAAAQGLHLYWADVSPILFGAHFDNVKDEQADALWSLLEATVQLDSENNRPPLAALFVSRRHGRRKPLTPFYVMYKKYYGVDIDDAVWEKIVNDIWASYQISDKVAERFR